MDLAAYLGRIGYDGQRAATHAVLAEVVLRHALSIPFENIDAFLGRRVSLDPAVVARKLVLSGRGGWCFEQNLLLGNALRALGFEVTDLAARVVWGRAADADAARTHRLLCVRIHGREWLADAGFGGQTLTGALRMDTEEAQSTPHEPFRLRRMGEERVLESLVRGEWLPLCRFDMQPQLPIDFEAANYQLAHDPASLFTQQLVVSRATREGRQVLRGNELVFHAMDGSTRREVLPDSPALLTALQAVFGITLHDAPQLAAKFEAQVGPAGRRS
jgi:N-hydroxyarylamine O-acetyltransferase